MFDFFMRYKTDKANIVSDALSRLPRNFIIAAKDDSGILKVLYEQALKIRDFSFKKEKTFPQKLFVTYHVTLVEMFDDFKSRLLFEYIKDEQ